MLLQRECDPDLCLSVRFTCVLALTAATIDTNLHLNNLLVVLAAVRSVFASRSCLGSLALVFALLVRPTIHLTFLLWHLRETSGVAAMWAFKRECTRCEPGLASISGRQISDSAAWYDAATVARTLWCTRVGWVCQGADKEASIYS